MDKIEPEVSVETRYYNEGFLNSPKKCETHVIKHGTERTWNRDGFLESETDYHMGRMHGKRILYYSNGNVRKILHYEHGEVHGEFKVFHRDGTTQTTGIFHKGRMHGEIVSYHDNGVLRNSTTFDKGMSKQDIFFYDKNGEIESFVQGTHSDKENFSGIFFHFLFGTSFNVARRNGTRFRISMPKHKYEVLNFKSKSKTFFNKNQWKRLCGFDA